MLDNLTILHEGLPNKHSRRILVVVTMLCRLNKTGCIKNEGIMLAGLMQAAPLLISGILRHAAVAHGDREIVSRLVDEPLWRYDWSRCADRTGRLAQALERLGIVPGDRVTTPRLEYPPAHGADVCRARNGGRSAHCQSPPFG